MFGALVYSFYPMFILWEGAYYQLKCFKCHFFFLFTVTFHRISLKSFCVFTFFFNSKIFQRQRSSLKNKTLLCQNNEIQFIYWVIFLSKVLGEELVQCFSLSLSVFCSLCYWILNFFFLISFCCFNTTLLNWYCFSSIYHFLPPKRTVELLVGTLVSLTFKPPF